jgi:hypothetical protein
VEHQAFAQLLGNYGEFIGAIGVVATLLFVAIQVRHSAQSTDANSQELKATRLRYGADSISRFSELIVANGEVANIWRRGVVGEELDKDEATRFFWLFRNFVQIHSTNYYDSSDVDPEKQASNADIVARLVASNAGLRQSWPRTATAFREARRDEFVDAVETRISALDSTSLEHHG